MRPRRPGAVGVWTLPALGVSLLAAVLATGPGRLAVARVELQTAADAAALAAAAELATGPDGSAERFAAVNRADGRAVRVELELGRSVVRAVAHSARGRAGATAAIEWNVVGLSPGDGCPAPLAPLAVPARDWEAQAEGDRPGDVRLPLGRLVAVMLDRSRDREGAAGGSPTAHRVGDPPAAPSRSRLLSEQVAGGLTAYELPRLELPAELPVWENPPAADVRAALEWLRDTGVPRAWPLAAGRAGDAVTVRRLVAARVVAIGRAGVVLRPCVLVTAAAVVGPHPPAGPRYLAKVRLAD